MEKERRTKALLLSTLVVVVATVSIAFAAMSRTLSINGIGKMDTASWSVYFDKLEGPNVVRGAKQVSAPSISQDKGTVQDINVQLFNPKDEISYTVDIVNDGTIDAEITMIKDIELTDVQKKVFEFKVTYTDTGEILQNGDILPKDTTKNITINIKFKDDITEFDLPTESQTINLSYQLTYTQYDGGNIPIIPDGGDINTGKAVLAHDVDAIMASGDPTIIPFFNGTLARGSVESISFINDTNVPTSAEKTKWDASESKDNSIIGWYEDVNSNGLYEVSIGSNNKIFAPEDCSALFSFMGNMKQINNINLLNTSNTTNMFYMFLYCVSLTSLDVSSFDTRNVTNMFGMFEYCTSVANINLSGFNTTNVVNMEEMFFNCNNLSSLNIEHFNTSKVINMSTMFYNCSTLEVLDLSSFDTSNVTDMSTMFYGCTNLNSLNIGSFINSKTNDLGKYFSNCINLTKIYMNNIDFSNMSYNGELFYLVPNNFTIYVKDEAAKQFILSLRKDANVIIEPLV